MKKYSVFSHTADIGLNVYAKTIKDIFKNAAEGMFSLLSSSVNKNKAIKKEFSVKGYDPENILVNWLNELLYLAYSEKALFHSYKIISLGKNSLTALVNGFKMYKDVSFPYEIKSVTYHNIKIKKTKTGYRTQVIFDI